MKAVITPFVQKELGVATFKVDQEVRKLVEAGRKFIMEPVPRELIEHMDDGLVVSEQTMATNEALQPFFNSDEPRQPDGCKLKTIPCQFSCCRTPRRICML